MSETSVPLLRVVRGDPSDAELAALVLAVQQVTRRRAAAMPRSRWLEDARTYPTWAPGRWS